MAQGQRVVPLPREGAGSTGGQVALVSPGLGDGERTVRYTEPEVNRGADGFPRDIPGVALAVQILPGTGCAAAHGVAKGPAQDGADLGIPKLLQVRGWGPIGVEALGALPPARHDPDPRPAEAEGRWPGGPSGQPEEPA